MASATINVTHDYNPAGFFCRGILRFGSAFWPNGKRPALWLFICLLGRGVPKRNHTVF